MLSRLKEFLTTQQQHTSIHDSDSDDKTIEKWKKLTILQQLLSKFMMKLACQ